MEKFLKKSKKDFCEGCSDLNLYDRALDGCLVCTGPMIDVLAGEKFRDESSLEHDLNLGYYHKCFESVSNQYNERSSAGGLGTSLLHALLETKEVDYVVSVYFDSNIQQFTYGKFDNINDLVKQQRSAYYPVKLTAALDIIENNKGVCAITGIPTAVKAIEILKLRDEAFAKKVKYTIGLVSGGIKVEEYTDYMCRKAGKPDGFADLEYVSYRDKPSDGDYWGNNYYFTASTSTENFKLKSDKIPMNWPSGLLKSFASDFCDDTFNICSDLTIMDAWLPRYKKTRGVSLAIARSKKLWKVIDESDDLKTSLVSKKDILGSQAGGLRHKTVGLKARIRIFQWFKNDIPSNFRVVSDKVGLIVLLEQYLRLRSSYITRKSYKRSQSFEKLDKELKPYLFLLRVVNKIKHWVS